MKTSAAGASVKAQRVNHDFTLLTDQDIYLFNEGTHFALYDKLGAHFLTHEGVEGTHFAVWAPDAEYVSVVGEFNGWDKSAHPLRPRSRSGIWYGFIPGIGRGAVYKYHVVSRYRSYRVDKSDPFAFTNELPPRTASVVGDLQHSWTDHA